MPNTAAPLRMEFMVGSPFAGRTESIYRAMRTGKSNAAFSTANISLARQAVKRAVSVKFPALDDYLSPTTSSRIVLLRRTLVAFATACQAVSPGPLQNGCNLRYQAACKSLTFAACASVGAKRSE